MRATHARVAALLIAFALPATAAAQTYRWTDAQGNVNYSQGIYSIPEPFRANARIIGGAEPAPVAATTAAPGATPGPKAPAAAAPGVTRIPFTPGRPIMVTARINGSGGSVDLMLDTGAQVTVINPRVLAALGVSMRNAQQSTIHGVTGPADALTVTVDSIDVSGAQVGPLQVVSHDAGSGGDGLLGRDFLDRFTVNIDNSAGVVTLTPRTAPAR
jgi:hypothetical protein